MLLAAILVQSQIFPPEFDRPITLDAKAVSGKQLTEELSARTGITFETVEQATFDRFTVHVDKAPLKDALTHIADAENGFWEKRGTNEYRLRRSDVKVAELRKASYDDVVKRFTKAQDGYRKQLAERPDFSDDAAQKLAEQWKRLGTPPNGTDNRNYWERENRLQQAVPIGRAFMRVLLAFTPQQLASIPIERKVVFSTNPTPMQYTLPDGAFDVLRDMVEEQVVWEDAVAKYLPDFANQGYNGMATGGRIRSITNAMVIFTRWDITSGIQAQLVLSDRKGRILTETYLYVEQPYDQPPAPQPKQERPAPPAEIELPDVDMLLARFFRYNTGDLRVRKPEADAEALKIVEDPEAVDPQATFVADGIIAIAKRRHVNFAGVVDDRTMRGFAAAIGKKGMRENAIDTAAGYGSEGLQGSAGWLVMNSHDPDRMDEVRCDRRALHMMLDAARAKGRLTLDDAATYATSAERFDENPIHTAYLTALLDRQGARTLQNNDKHVLRFYGSLDPSLRIEVDHLPIARLNGTQLAELDKILYGTYANLEQTDLEPPTPDDNGEYTGMWNTIAREPTVSLGDGIPGNAYVKISSDRENVILAHMQYGDWDQGQQTYDANSLGWMIASRETGQGGDPGWTVLGLSAADQSKVTIEFNYTPRLKQTMELDDTLPTTKESPFVERLPDELRAKLLKAIDEARQQYARGGGVQYFGGGGAVTPP